MTISKDRVKPSPLPDSWKLKEIFATGIVLGGYLALMTVIFFWIMKETDFFPVRSNNICFYVFFPSLNASPFETGIAMCFNIQIFFTIKCRTNLV